MRPALLALALAVAVSGCAGHSAAIEGGPDAPDAPDGLGDTTHERYFTLWWRGARIGTAVERERRGAASTHLVRRERIALRRGDALSTTELELAIDADAALRATTVTLTERDGAHQRIGRAVRAADGAWRIEVAGEPVRSAPAAAVPAELVPLWVRRHGGFHGAVLLPARGFAVARADVIARGAGRFEATIVTAGGALASSVTTDRDGDALRVVGADGVVARRVSAAEAATPFAPPDAIRAGAIPIAGARDDEEARRPAHALHVVLDAVDRPPPPPLPGQRVDVDATRWRITLDPALAGGPAPGRGAPAPAAIAALARRIAADIVDDLGADPGSASADPRTATAGDCTVHALAFAARAADQGIDTRLVTGFRLDDGALVRHRWALAWTGSTWMAVDPTYGEAPAAPRLLGLAVHGASRADLAVADAAFAGVAGAVATITP